MASASSDVDSSAPKASDALRAAAAEVQDEVLYQDPVAEKDSKKIQKGPGAEPLPMKARIKGQNFAVVAFVDTSSTKRVSRGRVPISIRGAFETQEEAETYVRDVLYPADPDHHHFVVSMWEWGIVPPTQREFQAMDMEYHNPEVQQYMAQYFASRESDRQTLKARKKFAKQAASNKRNPENKALREESRKAARRQMAKAIWKPEGKPEGPEGTKETKEEAPRVAEISEEIPEEDSKMELID